MKNTKINVTNSRNPRPLSDDLLRSVSGGAPVAPAESLTLNYGQIEWVYTQQKRPDGSGGGNVTAKYDLVKAKGA